jgi:spore germination protein GerM
MRANTGVVFGAVAVAVVSGILAFKVGALRAIVGGARNAPAASQTMNATPSPHGSDSVVPLTGKPRNIALPYYVVKQTSGDPVLVEQTVSLKAAGSVSIWRQAHTALTAMAGYPESQGALHNPLPAGSRVLGVHLDRNSIATVDLSREFRDNFNGGAREEQVTIYALVNTVGAIDGVQGVRFSIAGKPMDEFAGHLDLSSPLTPDQSLVEPAR